tara:strand:- start:1963 stop:2436 length:474 start_codon:yes stop_codon:yes gene_type:complete
METTNKTSFVLTENARTDLQKETMARIEADGVCPFCAEHFETYHTEPVLKKTKNWILTTNFSPYGDGKAQHHFLFVYNAGHINKPGEMTDDARIELFDLVDELSTKHNLEGGSILMRFGDGKINGSSVEHLHAHLIVGQRQDENTKGLKVKVGYIPK